MSLNYCHTSMTNINIPTTFTACALGTWGTDCLQNCSCVTEHESSPCNAVDGTCNCLPGYTGMDCNGSKFTHHEYYQNKVMNWCYSVQLRQHPGTRRDPKCCCHLLQGNRLLVLQPLLWQVLLAHLAFFCFRLAHPLLMWHLQVYRSTSSSHKL